MLLAEVGACYHVWRGWKPPCWPLSSPVIRASFRTPHCRIPDLGPLLDLEAFIPPIDVYDQ